MVIKKSVEYIFDPDEADAAEVFEKTTDPFYWQESPYSFPNRVFTKTQTFFIDDSMEYFSKILEGGKDEM